MQRAADEVRADARVSLSFGMPVPNGERRSGAPPRLSALDPAAPWGDPPTAGLACLSEVPRREGTSLSRAGARPGASRIVAGALGPVAGEEAVTDSVSVGPGATRPESGHRRRTSRTAHPRTTGAAAQRPGATRIALGPHTPDRGRSADPPPSRACGSSASERCRPSRLLREAGRVACRRGPTALPPPETSRCMQARDEPRPAPLECSWGDENRSRRPPRDGV